jgi:ABC-type multidrug transport system fused ATPase/permease subunit
MNAAVPTSGLAHLLSRLWSHLSRRRRRQFRLLTILMLLSAFAEVISVSAVLPFLGVLLQPERVLKYRLVARAAHAWGITSGDQLVLPMTLAFAIAALVAGAIRTLMLWVNTRLAYAAGADLSMEAYRRTLYQPYTVHVSRSSSEVISGIVHSVNTATGVLLSSLSLISAAVLMVFVILALIAIDPLVAIVATMSFGSGYALINWISRRRLRLNSERIEREHMQVIKALQEGLGGIRDVLLDGTQPVYCAVYQKSDQQLRAAYGTNFFIAGSPRFAMEALGMVLIAVLAYGPSRHVGGIAAALPVIGALALGAQRLLPALQQIYYAWANIVGNQASLASVLELLNQPLPANVGQPAPNPLPFSDSIRFDNVRFRYGPEQPWVLDGFNLTIPHGARVGFVGSTGSGKSTALDLLMGLLPPMGGALMVDGEPVIGDRVSAWQRTIAHVPQSIYLSDATVAENIAFGVPRDMIDMQRVRLAAKQAQIADFIEGRADGYDGFVGERGMRLSGGQRQRIGIARALYKRASVLVFDEATSALDNETERSVMDSIETLNRDLTILLIAHRLSTVRRCDIVVELDHGKVVAQGSYEHLLQCSPTFRRMAHAAA